MEKSSRYSMVLNQHITAYVCLRTEKAQARQFDRFILFDRIKWVWWVRNGSSHIKKEWNLTNIIEFRRKLMIIIQIKFVFFCTPSVLTRLNHDTCMVCSESSKRVAWKNANSMFVCTRQKKTLKQNTSLCVQCTYMFILHVRKWISVFAYTMNTWMFDSFLADFLR